MEPVSIDTPRGTPMPVARLDMRPIDVEALIDVEFVPVANDLAPATLALARLPGGTLIGFTHLDHGPEYGVDVVEYEERPPRDVLIELLYDTGITHDGVLWTAAAPGADERMWARSLSEAYLYFLLNIPSSEGGDTEVLNAVVTSQVGENEVMRYGDIELWVPPERPGRQPLTFADYSYPDDPPSSIFDAANWFAISQHSAAAVQSLLERYQAPFDPAVYHEVLKYLLRASAAAQEALKFIPPGADAVPVTACWTPSGLANYRVHAGEMRRDKLEHAAREYSQAAENWQRTVGPTAQD